MHLELKPVSQDSLIVSSHATNVTSSLLHRRLGHISDQYLKTMCKHGSIDGLGGKVDTVCDCETCLLSKGARLPHNHTRPRAVRHLENVHVDLSGIMRTKGLRNEAYYILFTDDFTSYCHIYPLRDKSKEEVFDVFKSYISRAERQTGCTVKTFTLDRGGEFLNSTLGTYL